MAWWLLTFFLGAILSLFLPEVPAISQLFLLLSLTIGCLFHKKIYFSSGLLFGALWVLTQAYLYHNQLPNSLIDLMQNKQAFVVEGEVLSIQAKSAANLSTKQKTNNTKRFNFRVSQVNNQKLSNSTIIRLSWKKATIEIAQGQKLSLNVKLKPAHGLANVGSLNYLTWLKANNISATGYVVNPNKKKDKKQHVNQLIEQKSTLRQWLFDRYQSISPNNELSPILMALAFGERSSLNPSHWQVLQATGTSHLIAISGLHVGLLASGTYLIVMLFMRYLPLKDPRWQRVNIRYLAIFMSLLLAVAYAYLAGFSLPTQRALVMLVLYWFSRLLGIRLSAKRLLLLTLFILILITPFSLFTVSFWLSFYAVVIIFLSLWRFKFFLSKGSAFTRFLKSLLIIQCALTLMLIPISAVFFQQISLVSLAANIVAVPWMSLVSIPCTLLSVFLMPFSEQVAQWFIALSLQSLTWLWQYLTSLSELSYASLSLSWHQQTMLLCLGGGTFIMVYLSPVKPAIAITKATAIILISVLISSFYLNSASEQTEHSSKNEKRVYQGPNLWQVVFFDVGQGLSILIKQNGHGILYDTGAAYPSGFNMSEAVILPYLQYIGMNKLDKVILSHSDNDHAGGFTLLENKIVIDEVISNDASISVKSVSPCYQGRAFRWQGLTFEVLSPQALSPVLLPNAQIANVTGANKTKEAKQSRQKNDDSCVVFVSDKFGRSILLTGDISSKIEQQLLVLFPTLTVDILQVPHHGSKTSSSEAFIKQLSPQLALVSAGYLNRWKMPVDRVKQRYTDNNVQLLNSAKVGQVIVTIDNNSMKVRSFTDDFRPFWISH